MIKMLRIDDRLLHGQVGYVWTKSLGADVVIVANTNAVNDFMMNLSLKLAKPAGCDLEVMLVPDTIAYINDEKNKRKAIFVIVDNTDDALEIVTGCDDVKLLNLGGIRNKPNSKMFGQAVYLTEHDIINCKAVMAKGVTVEIQEIPSRSLVNLKSLV